MSPLTLSRMQFGDTAAFHILWPIMSIGLALYMLVMEVLWLYTKNEVYYRQLRFWTKIFILTFVIGTATGIPLEFEFGTNWATFSNAAGDFFGNILGFESTVAFALEAAFLAIFVFGWKRVGPKMHLFANAMIALGAVLSGFWIMVANSWMQVPVGVTLVNGKLIVTDYMAAIFNPASMVSFLHMTVACLETTLFMIAGISAWALLSANRRAPSAGAAEGALLGRNAFFLQSFKYSLALAIVIVPLQIGLGDMSGTEVATYQPAKLAAMELHWQTNLPGTGAAWSIIAWPDAAAQQNSFDLAIPDALSLITTHSPTGQVAGITSFAADSRPTTSESVIVFYSFRIMVAIGFALFALMLLGAWYWYQGKLVAEKITQHKTFWRLFVWSIPLGFIATETGWMVREIGRQPWVVYHLMRTSEGLSSNLSGGAVAASTAIFTLMYVVFGALFIYFTYRIVQQGPDLKSPVETYVR